MKHTLLLIFCFVAFCSLKAQITITNNSFPAVGDTLITATDNLPTGVIITTQGGDQSWDFSSLQAPFTSQEEIKDVSEGESSALFPNAEAFTGELGETYINIEEDKYEMLGYVGPDPLDFGIALAVNFNPPMIERRAPMNFFDINTSNSETFVALSADQIPSEILDNLPLVPDSIRILTEIERLDVVDAWGTLAIPGGTYDVLREKRFETRDTKLEIRVVVGPVASWIDVTDAAPFPGLGLDTTITYRFMAEGEKEIIAIVTVDNDDETLPTRVQFKSNDIIISTNDVVNKKSNIYAYPNPAIEDVRFEFTNLPTGNYTLKIYNILGVPIWDTIYHISQTKTVKVNLSSFRKGTYLYSLVDENGKTIKTKRLVILRP